LQSGAAAGVPRRHCLTLKLHRLHSGQYLFLFFSIYTLCVLHNSIHYHIKNKGTHGFCLPLSVDIVHYDLQCAAVFVCVLFCSETSKGAVCLNGYLSKTVSLAAKQKKTA
jgi:hypothetical protein